MINLPGSPIRFFGDVHRARYSIYEPTAIVTDYFTDTNGTALTSHTPDLDTEGGGWAIAGSGTPEIQSNHLEVPSGAVANFGIIESGVADCIIELDMTRGESTPNGNYYNGSGIIFRYTDTDNYWCLSVDDTQVSLHLRNGGSNSRPDYASYTPTVGVATHFKVIISGSSITGIIDYGTVTLTTTDSTHATVTKHGYKYWRSTTYWASADNFTVVA